MVEYLLTIQMDRYHIWWLGPLWQLCYDQSIATLTYCKLSKTGGPRQHLAQWFCMLEPPWTHVNSPHKPLIQTTPNLNCMRIGYFQNFRQLNLFKPLNYRGNTNHRVAQQWSTRVPPLLTRKCSLVPLSQRGRGLVTSRLTQWCSYLACEMAM